MSAPLTPARRPADTLAVHARGRLVVGAAAGAIALASASPCAATEARVAILAPETAPILGRLERNVRSLALVPVVAAARGCARALVTKLLAELESDTAVCVDADTIAVWARDGDEVALREVVVVTGSDERHLEVDAARAALALRGAFATRARGGTASVTIVASGPDLATRPELPAAGYTPRDRLPPPPVPVAAPRLAPALLLAAGPGMISSRDGNSFALSFAAEIGLSRAVALVPWLNFVPANRTVERPEGTASFRPTLFGLGFSMPILPATSRIVPRLGGGYAMLWMHVAGEKANAPATTNSPEDLLAPAIYATFAVSVRVASQLRVAAEALGGSASHDLVVRIAMREAAHWGVPFGGLALRGEWVLP
jgi:hypothetical protein